MSLSSVKDSGSGKIPYVSLFDLEPCVKLKFEVMGTEQTTHWQVN